MALKHIVLAVVSDTLAHGYELHAEVAAAFPVARPCDTARVYGILVGLEQAGLVTSCFEPAARGRTRKRYRITSSGLDELRAWMKRPRPGGALLRRALLVRLAFLESRGRRECLREVAGIRPSWEAAIDRREVRREGLLWSVVAESRIERWIRNRSVAHVEAELRVLRLLV